MIYFLYVYSTKSKYTLISISSSLARDNMANNPSINKKNLTMKKLTGMKRAFSSENKKLNRNELKSVNGGRYAIKSNVLNGSGCTETDYYSSNGGEYIERSWLCIG